jgi:transglutaminase-like putative cysteine protease
MENAHFFPEASLHHSALRATAFIDADAPEVVRFAARHAGSGDDRQRAVRLYYAVRDSIRYDMTTFGLDPVQFKASKCLDADSAFCVPKAIALAAAARAARIPVLRDNQGENGATIWMRMPLRGCRREGVARP